MQLGLDVEIDVWCHDGIWELGHDFPIYEINFNQLMNKKLWCHAKNLEALTKMLTFQPSINCFWHQSDNYTLTSNGYIWTYPGNKLTDKSIVVLTNEFDNFYNKKELKKCYAICSDNVKKYR